MPDTEKVDTFVKLTLIMKRARKEPGSQFTCLAHLLNEGFLKAYYMKLGRDRASGIDNVTWKEYGEELDENLQDLVTRLKAKRYKPQPAKPVRQYVRFSGVHALLREEPERELHGASQNQRREVPQEVQGVKRMA